LTKKKAIDFHDHRFIRVTKAVMDDEVYLYKPIQKLVYGVLCFYADNKTLKSYPSVKTIANKCLCSENTARSALRRLAEMELIDITPRTDKNGQTSNEYTVLEPPEWFENTSPPKNDTDPLQIE
jgi:hypothetical protein